MAKKTKQKRRYMTPVIDVSEVEKKNYKFFSEIPIPAPKSIGADMKTAVV